MEVPKDEAQHEGRIVLAEIDEGVKPTQQAQYSLKYFFGKGEAKPVVPELKKANKGGRPSYHSLALKEAEKKGEEIVQLTKDELETLLANQVQSSQLAVNARGKAKSMSIADASRSNRKRLGAVTQRREYNVKKQS